MLEAIQQTLLNTPWWVYLLFAYVVFVGIKAKQGGVVPFRRLLIMPIVLTFLSFHTLLTMTIWRGSLILAFIFALAAGVFWTCQLVCRKKIKVDKKKYLLDLPGSYFTLILVFLIFAVKYYIGMRMGMNPQVATHISFQYFVFLIWNLHFFQFLKNLQ